MIQNRSLSPDLSDPAQSARSVIDEIFSLTASRTLQDMLGKALRMVVELFGAEAGSILFQVQAAKNVRSGAFRPEALKRIQHWEDVIGQRLRKGRWQIPEDTTLPVSSFQLQESDLLLLNTPLMRQTSVVGALSFVLPPGRHFSPAQRQLLEQLARGLGEAASLVMDLELANRRLNQISIFYDVGQALVTTFDTAQLLSDAMKLATDVIDAGAASIVLIDEARNELVFKVSHGSRGPVLQEQRIPIDEGIAGWVARHDRPVIANNARGDSRFSHRVDVRTGFLTQSIAAVPLKAKGRIIGVLEVLNKYAASGFNEEDVQLMSHIATQSAIAIENARLYDRLREKLERTIKTQDVVRHELTRSLSQGPLHFLSAIDMGLDHLERLSGSANPNVIRNEINALRNLVHQATKDTKTILFDLSPAILESEGLVVAIEAYVDRLQHTNLFKVHLKTIEQVYYPARTARVIYSIVQEAVNNVKAHAGAENLWLALEVKRGRFIVTVRDDGQGFEPDGLDRVSYEKTFGLENMRTRAVLIDAELQIESRTRAPDRGTTVRLILPWKTLESEAKVSR